MVAHVVYVYKFLLIDLDGSMFAFLGILGFAGTTFVMIIIFFLRRKMKSLFYKFSEIYDDSKCWFAMQLISKFDDIDIFHYR